MTPIADARLGKAVRILNILVVMGGILGLYLSARYILTPDEYKMVNSRSSLILNSDLMISVAALLCLFSSAIVYWIYRIVVVPNESVT